MAKITKRFNVKGDIDSSNLTVTEYDKDGNETVLDIQEVLSRFDGLPDVTLTLSQDSQI